MNRESEGIKDKELYQKHKIEKKISIFYFPYTKIKPVEKNNKLLYPLYFRVTWNKKNTLIKSIIPVLHEEQTEEFNYLVRNAILIESNFVKEIIKILDHYQCSNVSYVSYFFDNYYSRVITLIHTGIENFIKKELKDYRIENGLFNLKVLEYLNIEKIINDVFTLLIFDDTIQISQREEFFNLLNNISKEILDEIKSVENSDIFIEQIDKISTILGNIGATTLKLRKNKKM